MTTPTLREALRRLVEALSYTPLGIQAIQAVAAAKGALATQPELPEPVGEIKREGVVKVNFFESCTYGCALPDGTKLYTAAQLQQAVEQAQAKREPMSEIGLATQTAKFYPPDEALASAIYMQAWRDAEAHHNIGDKA